MNILITGIHGFVGSNLLSNLKTQHKIFDHFIESQATIFIFFSSVKAVADTVTGTSLTEEQTPNPQTPYGKSKREAEIYILNKFQTSGFQVPTSVFGLPTSDKKLYILRPCMIHGPWNKGNLNLLYRLVSKGILWPLGAYKNKRSFTLVNNLNPEGNRIPARRQRVSGRNEQKVEVAL